MAKKTAKKKAEAPEPFEESLAKLEGIVADLEGGELGLADALARYEEGVGRLKQCHAQLESAERRIELLSGVDADGNPVTTPFDDSATADGKTSRSAKRSAAGQGGEGVDDGSTLF
ncbi:MAG: exodeoxyribonuclease VII small subunit [Planctomycetota bacterium]